MEFSEQASAFGVTVPFFDHQHHYEHVMAVTERSTNLVFRFGTAATSNASVLEQIDLVGERVLPAARAA